MRFGGISAAIVFGVANIAAMPVHLVPNQATYDVSLAHTSNGGAVAARGRMVIQFRDTCDGWSTAQRMVTDMTNADGAIIRSDFLVTAWESKNGKIMRFDVKRANAGKRPKETRGTASTEADGSITVSLLSPDRRRFTLPAGTIFPSGQMLEIAKAAAHGGGTVRQLVFQGGDEGDFYISTAVVGKIASVQQTAAERAVDKAGLLRNVTAWTTLVSYFADKRGADLPDYEIASRLYANGISGSMSLIYTHYVLRATLSRLEPLAPTCSSELAGSPAEASGAAAAGEPPRAGR